MYPMAEKKDFSRIIACEKAISAIELALALPILLLSLTLTVDLGHSLIVLSDLTGPCYEAARFASGTNGLTNDNNPHISTYYYKTGQLVASHQHPPSGSHGTIHDKIKLLLEHKPNLSNSVNPTVQIVTRVIEGATPNDVSLVEIQLATQYEPFMSHFIPAFSGGIKQLRLAKTFQTPYRL